MLVIGYASAQSSKDKEIINDSNDAKVAFIKQDPQMAGSLIRHTDMLFYLTLGKAGLALGVQLVMVPFIKAENSLAWQK